MSPNYKNKVLASLSPRDRSFLAPHLIPQEFKLNEILHNVGETIQEIYFLEDGICSLVVVEGSRMIEVGVVGRDGYVGVPAMNGAEKSTYRSFIQIPGSGFRIKAKTLSERAWSSRALQLLLQRSVLGLLAQVAQTAACNGLHQIHERLARWLLTCHDRVQMDRMPLTHEFLAVMLGASRPSVTIAARTLQQAGLINYTRGHITVRDFKGLRDASCACYAIVRDEDERLGLI